MPRKKKETVEEIVETVETEEVVEVTPEVVDVPEEVVEPEVVVVEEEVVDVPEEVVEPEVVVVEEEVVDVEPEVVDVPEVVKVDPELGKAPVLPANQPEYTHEAWWNEIGANLEKRGYSLASIVRKAKAAFGAEFDEERYVNYCDEDGVTGNSIRNIATRVDAVWKSQK